MEEKILDVLREVLGSDNIDRTCSQSTCDAWDSMNQLNIVLGLEDAFGISLEPEEIGEMKSFDDIVRILLKRDTTMNS